MKNLSHLLNALFRALAVCSGALLPMQNSFCAAETSGIKILDFCGKTERSIVAQGSVLAADKAKAGYQAHPTTATPDGGKTIYCVWNLGHGGNARPLAKSVDGGKTWTRHDAAMPACYSLFKNCPSIYNIVDKNGRGRLFVLAQFTSAKWAIPAGCENYKGYMPRVVSEDGGLTWRALPPLGELKLSSPFVNVMTFSSMVRLKDGSTLGLFHRGEGGKDSRVLTVLQSRTDDGGFTWSKPEVVCSGFDIGNLAPCEPCVFRSPDGGELCCIMRENTRKLGRSLVMFSRDEGKTWSKPISAPAALTGDRHQGIQLPDGRLAIVFRNQVPDEYRAPLRLAVWVGTYGDIKNCREGQYRIFLSKSFNGDGYYSGIHLLDGGTVLVTTYESIKAGENCSIVSHRFKIPQ